MQDLSQFKSAYDVAVELGVHKATINRIAKENEIGTPFGPTKIRLFTKSEVKRIHQLCHVQKGNPNFSKKN